MIPVNEQTLSQKGALPISDAKSPSPPPSLLYTIIPTAVRIKIPRFPSLRSWPSRSRSQCRTLKIHPSSGSTGAEIEPLSYHSRPSFLRSSSSTLSSSAMTDDREPTWKYANQGLALLETAVSESQCPHLKNQGFSRQLYIHALTYLLQGLPSNLTNQETLTIQNALPPSLQIPSHPPLQYRQPEQEPSLLHRIVASSILRLFLLVHLLLPHIKLLLRNAYEYERTHHASEKLLAVGMETVDRFCRKGIDVCGKLGNGRMGELLGGSVAWWVEGFSGGVAEGVGEGMRAVGAVGVR